MIAVLVLGGRWSSSGDAPWLELAAARGASTGQLRGILGLEGLVIACSRP
jgi:putative ABC transport system permease protein